MKEIEKKYQVIDKLVGLEAEKPRRHEFIDPITHRKEAYDFVYSKPTIVPEWIAIKCLSIPEGFSVFDDKGIELELREPDQEKGIVLKHNETVASYDELTLDALRVRAEQIQGYSTSIKGKDSLINFLMLRSKDSSIVESSEIQVELDDDIILDTI